MNLTDEVMKVLKESKGGMTTLDVINKVYPDMDPWDESSKRAAVSKKLHMFMRYKMVRREITQHPTNPGTRLAIWYWTDD